MKSLLALALALLSIAVPVVAAAQSARPSDAEKNRKREVVLPKQSSDKVQSDAERAVDDFAGPRKPAAPVVNQVQPVPPRDAASARETGDKVGRPGRDR